MLEHGGRVIEAAKQYGIALNDWIDLSTGVNPVGLPVPDVPPAVWQRLPERKDDFEGAARDYYKTEMILPVAGAQAALQALPKLRGSSQVGIIMPSYREHFHAWSQHGHKILSLRYDELAAASERLDVIVLCNPNNPTGTILSPTELSNLHRNLAARDGWLIIDESFIDTIPPLSMIAKEGKAGLIVLRSLGKFFGLAGARVGFVHGPKQILHAIEEYLGPWNVNGPARWIGRQALRDRNWHVETRKQLEAQSARLTGTLARHGLTTSGGTAFFQWSVGPRARQLHESLARRGILTRLFDEPLSIRIGLPVDESAWRRLNDGLLAFSRQHIPANESFLPSPSTLSVT